MITRDRRWQGWRGIALALCALVLLGGNALAAVVVQDDGGLFSAQARDTATTRANAIERDTKRTIAVRTVASLGTSDIATAANQAFQQARPTGMLIFATKNDHKLEVKVADQSRQAISPTEETAIRDLMLARFTAGDFDGGLLAAVDRAGTDLRTAFQGKGQGNTTTQPLPATQRGSSFPWLLLLIPLLIIVACAFLFSRRNRTAPAYQGSPPSSGYGQTNSGPGPGYGQGQGQGQGYGPGYGQNYGPQGGNNMGRNIAGGLAAGVGGAIIGNVIYDELRDHNRNPNDNSSGANYGNENASQNSSDWSGTSSDPGSAGDWSGASGDSGSSGDWGGASDSGSSGDWSGGDSSSS